MENELDTEVLNSEENLDSNQETEEVVYQDNSELVKAKEIAENLPGTIRVLETSYEEINE